MCLSDMIALIRRECTRTRSILTDAMASCRLGLGFLLADVPNILFMFDQLRGVAESRSYGRGYSIETRNIGEAYWCECKLLLWVGGGGCTGSGPVATAFSGSIGRTGRSIRQDLRSVLGSC